MTTIRDITATNVRRDSGFTLRYWRHADGTLDSVVLYNPSGWQVNIYKTEAGALRNIGAHEARWAALPPVPVCPHGRSVEERLADPCPEPYTSCSTRNAEVE